MLLKSFLYTALALMTAGDGELFHRHGVSSTGRTRFMFFHRVFLSCYGWRGNPEHRCTPVYITLSTGAARPQNRIGTGRENGAHRISIFAWKAGSDPPQGGALASN